MRRVWAARGLPLRAGQAGAAILGRRKQAGTAQCHRHSHILPAAEKRKAEAAGGGGEEGDEALRLELESAEFERAKVGAGARWALVQGGHWYAPEACLPERAVHSAYWLAARECTG